MRWAHPIRSARGYCERQGEGYASATSLRRGILGVGLDQTSIPQEPKIMIEKEEGEKSW